MNLFAIAGVTLSIACFSLAGLIFVYSKSKLHTIWGLFNVSVAIFGLGTFFVGMSKTPEQAFSSWKITFFGIAFISTFFYHVVFEFCHLSNKKILLAVYAHGISFSLCSIFTNFIISSLRWAFNEFYYYDASFGFNLFFSIWLLIVFTAFIHLLLYIKRANGLKAIQGKYFCFGMMLGFLSGSTTSLPSWGINIYPAWHFLICVYAGISTYAIFKYQILNIRIAISRIGIFFTVYTIVLGIPFGAIIWGRHLLVQAFGDNWFWVPMISLLVLATAGPFIYLYFQRKAEERILEEEREIQDILTKASYGMMTVHSLEKLLPLVIDVLTKSLRLEYAAIYLYDSGNQNYILKTSKIAKEKKDGIPADHELIDYLNRTKTPLIFEEIKMFSNDQRYDDSSIIWRQMQGMNASVIVPLVADNILLGFVVLGERKDKGIYSAELINVLSVLGNQCALAIENALFIQEHGKTLMEQFQKHRLEGLGMLSVNISHQMHNRFQAIMTAAGFANEMLKNLNLEETPKEKLIEIINKFSSSSSRVVENCLKGAEISEAIKNYAKADPTPKPVVFDAVINNSLAMVALNHKKFRFELIKDYPQDVVLWINFATMQDVIYNAIDNSCDAMELKARINPNGGPYQPTVTITGHVEDDKFRFEISDNGIGIKDEHQDQILVPLFTTKSTSNKGTGMGMPAIIQFIEQNKGTFDFKSKYEEGTTLIISLPLATQEQRGQNDENIIRG